MKECEKIWAECKIPERDGIYDKATFYQGWKAALEWIYFDICPKAWDVGDVEFDINQELKGK